MIGSEYIIYLGATEVGRVKSVKLDFPNIIADFEPSSEFIHFQQLFEADYNLIRGPASEWRAARNEIFEKGVRLVSPNGASEFIGGLGDQVAGNVAYLHVHNSKVWWRII